MVSGGTEFCKALEDAVCKANTHAIEDGKLIKDFINTKTGFKVVSLFIEQGKKLTIKAVSK